MKAFFAGAFWTLFGVLLTPMAILVVVGFYAWPEMIIHTYKFAVCYSLFYFMLTYEGTPIWDRQFEWSEKCIDKGIRKVVKDVARNRS